MIAVVGAVRFWRWMFSGPPTPDPWDDAVAASLEDEKALPVCHRCFTEHAVTTCFCERCGAAVGEYNNYLPFEYLFSEGEVLRNGTTLRMRPSFIVVAGYFLLSIAAYMPFIFVLPVYWILLIRNLVRPAPLEPPPPPALAPAP